MPSQHTITGITNKSLASSPYPSFSTITMTKIINISGWDELLNQDSFYNLGEEPGSFYWHSFACLIINHGHFEPLSSHSKLSPHLVTRWFSLFQFLLRSKYPRNLTPIFISCTNSYFLLNLSKLFIFQRELSRLTYTTLTETWEDKK